MVIVNNNEIGGWKKWLKVLGFGLLFVSVVIGILYLVLFIRVGVYYGMIFFWIILFVFIFKYFFYEFGLCYVNVMGFGLLKGYKV